MISAAIDAYFGSGPRRPVRFRTGFLTAVKLCATSRLHDNARLSRSLFEMAVSRIEAA